MHGRTEQLTDRLGRPPTDLTMPYSWLEREASLFYPVLNEIVGRATFCPHVTPSILPPAPAQWPRRPALWVECGIFISSGT